MFLAIGPFGRIASFKEVVVDLGNAAGARPALAAHIGLEVGHTRLFHLGRGSFLPRLRSVFLRRCLADAAVDVGGGCEPHIVGDVSIDVQRGGRRHMAQHSGECFHIHAVFQRQRCKGMAQVMEANMLAPCVFQDELQSAAHYAGGDGAVLLHRGREHPSGVHRLFVLPQHLNHRRRQDDLADGVLRLGRADLELAPHVVDLLVHV